MRNACQLAKAARSRASVRNLVGAGRPTRRGCEAAGEVAGQGALRLRINAEAKLYARELDVVDEMRKRFEANLGGFFDAVTEALSARTWLGQLVTARQGKSFYVYLSRLPVPSAELEACLWTPSLDPGIIRHHGVCWRVARAGGSPAERARIAALAADPVFATSLMATPNTRSAAFEVWIEWAEDGDAVQATVDALDPMLRRLDEAR